MKKSRKTETLRNRTKKDREGKKEHSEQKRFNSANKQEKIETEPFSYPEYSFWTELMKLH